MCNHELEFDYTRDIVYPFGDIVSIPVFKCSKCGEYLECEDYQRMKYLKEQANEKYRRNL